MEAMGETNGDSSDPMAASKDVEDASDAAEGTSAVVVDVDSEPSPLDLALPLSRAHAACRWVLRLVLERPWAGPVLGVLAGRWARLGASHGGASAVVELVPLLVSHLKAALAGALRRGALGAAQAVLRILPWLSVGGAVDAASVRA